MGIFWDLLQQDELDKQQEQAKTRKAFRRGFSKYQSLA